MTFLLLLILGSAVGAIWLLYNVHSSLVARRESLREAFSQVDTQLKRRHAAVSKLVEASGKHLKHERAALDAAATAKNSAAEAVSGGGNDDVDRISAAEVALSAAVDKLLSLSERHPGLAEDQDVLRASDELASAENRVLQAGKAYNDDVSQYNAACEQFPAVLVAGLMGMPRAPLFQHLAQQAR